MQITTVGLDLAKNIFHVVCCNQAGKVVKKRTLKRREVIGYFRQLTPCLVGMEACASSHYWARELERLGHRVKQLPPKAVKAYLAGQKNDYNDAAAIAEAASRIHIRAVAIKSVQQQDIQVLQRLRRARSKERTALCNQLRGLLAEYGIIVSKGVNQLRKQLPEILEDGDNGLSMQIRPWLHQCYQQLLMLDEYLSYFTDEVKRHSQSDEGCQRLQKIPGFGPIVSSAFVAYVGDGSGFRRGREVSASLGVVPRQHSSGGKTVLLGISKRGDKDLRSLLIHGARSVVRHADKKDDTLSRWIRRIKAERGANKAAVALANKLARIGWAILANKSEYCTA